MNTVTLKVTYIGKDNFDREVFQTETGAIRKNRVDYLVDVGIDYSFHQGRSFCTKCGDPFYGEPDCPLWPGVQVIVTNEEERRKANENPFRFTYMLLDKLRIDCEYHIRMKRLHGFECIKDIPAHLTEMRRLWHSLPSDGKPEWLSLEEIEKFEKQM